MDMLFNLEYGVSLADYNSWRVGGAARCLFSPRNAHEIQAFLSQLSQNGPSEKIRFLGLGSNILVPDEGFDGTVILTRGALREMTVVSAVEDTVRLEAGVPCGTAVRFCARHGLQGLEFLAGIPGTIGGALALNAGAHGQEIWSFVTHCETVDREGQVRLRPAGDYQAHYRYVEQPSGEWFLAAHLKLAPGPGEESLARIKTLLAHRAQTQPIDWPNCGSVFRNPRPYYAARLIEDCGLKGLREGGAQISKKHANFIINYQSARAADIADLMAIIQETVKKKCGINLMPEVHVFK